MDESLNSTIKGAVQSKLDKLKRNAVLDIKIAEIQEAYRGGKAPAKEECDALTEDGLEW